MKNVAWVEKPDPNALVPHDVTQRPAEGRVLPHRVEMMLASARRSKAVNSAAAIQLSASVLIPGDVEGRYFVGS